MKYKIKTNDLVISLIALVLVGVVFLIPAPKADATSEYDNMTLQVQLNPASLAGSGTNVTATRVVPEPGNSNAPGEIQSTSKSVLNSVNTYNLSYSSGGNYTTTFLLDPQPSPSGAGYGGCSNDGINLFNITVSGNAVNASGTPETYDAYCGFLQDNYHFVGKQEVLTTTVNVSTAKQGSKDGTLQPKPGTFQANIGGKTQAFPAGGVAGLYTSEQAWADSCSTGRTPTSQHSDDTGVGSFSLPGITPTSTAGQKYFFVAIYESQGVDYVTFADNVTINPGPNPTLISLPVATTQLATELFDNGEQISACPTTPGNVKATATGPTSVSLSWSASTEKNGTIAGYNIIRNGAIVNHVAGSLTSYADNGLSSNTSYTYNVEAYDANGVQSQISPAVTVTTPAGPQKQNNDASSCESSDFELNWIMCPIIEIMWKMGDIVQSQVDNLLTININTYFNDSSRYDCGTSVQGITGSCNASYTDYNLWSSFRDISLSLLIIAGLIMVLSQALDFGPFDAYTIRKMLPRILIAVILISFSWEIGRLAVQLSDDLGNGMSDLVNKIATGSTTLNLTFTGPKGASGGLIDLLGTGAFIGLAVAAGFALIALWGFVALMLLSALIAVIIGFAVLAFRQLLVIICVIAAPLAFLAYIMPGGQRLWKMWQTSFVGALAMFPAIAALLSFSKVISVVEWDSNKTFMGFVIAMVIWFGPYFLLPKIAKSSMGFLGTVANLMSNLSKGVRQPVQKFRQNRLQQRLARMREGGFEAKYKFGYHSALNRMGLGMAAGARGRYGFGARGKVGRASAWNAAAEEKMKDGKFVDDTFNDNVRLAFESGSASAAKSAIHSALKASKKADGSSYTDAEIEEATKDALNRVALHGGFTATNRLAALKLEASNKGRNFGSAAAANAAINGAADAVGLNRDDLRGNVSYQMRSSGIYELGDLNDKLSEERQVVNGVRRANQYQLATQSTARTINMATRAFETLADDEVARHGQPQEDSFRLAVWGRELSSLRQNATGQIADAATANSEGLGTKVDDILNDPKLLIPDPSIGPGYVPNGVVKRREAVDVTRPGPGGTTETKREYRDHPTDTTTVGQIEADKIARTFRQNPNEL